MPKHQGFSSIILIIIVILVLGGGYWVWKSNDGSRTSIIESQNEMPMPVDTNIEPPPTDGNPSPISQPLTIEKILNSNGYTNGENGMVYGDGYSRINKNEIVFGDIDGDKISEAVASITSCGASCGIGVAVFKFDRGNILMDYLPETGVSGAMADIRLIKIDEGKIFVVMYDFGGEKTKMYTVKFIDGKLKFDPPVTLMTEGDLP